jgi:hypothetical protein
MVFDLAGEGAGVRVRHSPGKLGAGPLLLISDVPKDVETDRYGDRCPVLIIDLSQPDDAFQLIDR